MKKVLFGLLILLTSCTTTDKALKSSVDSNESIYNRFYFLQYVFPEERINKVYCYSANTDFTFMDNFRYVYRENNDIIEETYGGSFGNQLIKVRYNINNNIINILKVENYLLNAEGEYERYVEKKESNNYMAPINEDPQAYYKKGLQNFYIGWLKNGEEQKEGLKVTYVNDNTKETEVYLKNFGLVNSTVLIEEGDNYWSSNYTFMKIIEYNELIKYIKEKNIK